MTTERLVVCAANRSGDYLICGIRHFDEIMVKQMREILTFNNLQWEQGFVDNSGVFMDRKEALVVAIAAGQINTRREKTQPAHLLFSEDLY